MLCMGLAEVVDIFAASICLTSLSLLFASVSYAVPAFRSVAASYFGIGVGL